ncbi:MAG TPA: nicotinate phosphoribosyltransferase [Candidatus Dormibacteraeota bacterium]|nr:nicotinate phosphoribosyltransferase [Candidatus Dormibacteraeota bacterium]
MTPYIADFYDYCTGPACDVYFQRAADTLAGERLDPVVAMEYFGDRAGILCGMGDVMQLVRRALGEEGEVWALEDGAPIAEREVVMRITARYSRIGRLETAVLGMLASGSGWATAAREIVDAAGGKRVISFGARHVHPLVGPIMEHAAVVGGCAGCATPLGAERAGLAAPSGTMPHAMILVFGDTVKAAVAFDQHMPEDVLRIVLVDTFKDEAEESLRVAEAMGERLRGVRLDTPWERGRVTVELVKEVRARLDLAGHRHVGIFVSGGLDVERVRQFVAAGAPVDSFGVGMTIAAAPPIGFTADIKEVDGEPRTKRGRVPGVIENPRLQRVV